MSTTGELSLYFHFPFCKKKCPYCHFYVIPSKPFHKKLLIDALKKEIFLRKGEIDKHQIASIYFGGGTPSLFPEGIEEVLSLLHWEEGIEITTEVNPEDVEDDLLRRFQAAGINRISMGIQSFEDSELLTLGRSGKAKTALQNIEKTLSYFPNLSLDLMYDVPGQTVRSFDRSIQTIANLPITHISLYNLTIEPHTLFYKTKPKQPDEEASKEMLTNAIATFSQKGFMRYEISAFCKKGYASNHNTGYWTGRPFLGFGPSAFSYYEKKRFQNVPNILTYAKELEKGSFPISYSEELPLVRRQAELLGIRLRLLEGVHLPTFEREEGLHQTVRHRLESLVRDGFLEQKESQLRLTEKGLLFYDTAMANLI